MVSVATLQEQGKVNVWYTGLLARNYLKPILSY